MLKEFNSVNLKDLGKDIEEALKLISAKHGITIEVGNMSYSPTTCNIKLKAVITGEDKSEEAIMKVEWSAKASRYGFKASDFGRSFKIDGKMFTISGVRPKNRSYPIIGTDANGKNYKFTSSMVREGLI